MTNNVEVKRKLRENGVPQWVLADRLSISENTLCRRLRYPLSDEDFETMVQVIRQIREEKR